MLHALMCQGKLTGIYSDYKSCTQMLEGLVQNRFVTRNQVQIKSYHENSIMVGQYEARCEQSLQPSDNLSEYETTMSESELDESIKEQLETERINRLNLQYELAKAKKEKERIDESQRTFEIDVSVYNKFKQVLENNQQVTIPDFFQDKYKLIAKLDKDNMLNWENFTTQYTPVEIETGYNKLFNSVSVNIVQNDCTN